MIEIKPKFEKGDYIINHNSMDMAIVKGVTKKGYYTFSEYYCAMFDELKDLKKYTYELQINYQKFFELCNDDEKKKFDDMVKEKKKG